MGVRVTLWVFLSLTAAAIVASPALVLVPELDIGLPAAPQGLCQDEARIVQNGLSNNSLWAMRMWDATAQGSSGALYGNTWQLGAFDECLQINEPVHTQYCLVTVETVLSIINPNADDVFSYLQETAEDKSRLDRGVQHSAVCVPASCNSQELEYALNANLNNNSTSGVKHKITVIPDLCTTSLHPPRWTLNEIFFCIFLGVLVLHAICGTILDKYTSSSASLVRALRCFSVTENWSRLLEVSPSERAHPFAVLHGVKVISMVIIFFGHRSGLPVGAASANYQDVETFQGQFYSMFLQQSDLVVDTFFFMSGVLATQFLYNLLMEERISPIQAIFARIARVAPAYYLLVWFQASIAHRTGSGPLWNYIQKAETETCQNYWWANLLFIQNYFSATKLCQIHSWYMGCDIHFFLMTILLCWILKRRPTMGKRLLAVLILVTPLLPAYIVYEGSLNPMIIFYDAFHANPRADPSFGAIYILSHLRVTVYLIGMAAGYYLLHKELSKYRLSTMSRVVGIGVAGLLICGVMAVGHLYYGKHPPGRLFGAIFAGLRRPTWAIGLTILLLIHRFTPKNCVSSLLSSHAALVLSKLTYTMYLYHFPFILFKWASTRSPKTTSTFNIYFGGLGDLAQIAVISVIIFIMIELPIKRLTREVMSTKNIDTTSQSKNPPPQSIVTVNVKF